MGNETGFSGEVLREFRKEHKLTQVALARLLDIERTYLARLETGKKIPSARLQKDIQETFNRYASEHKVEDPRAAVGNASPARSRLREIPVVSWAAAGKATDYQDLAAQIDEVVGSDVTDPNAFAVIIEGDSMEPDFKAGDRVVVSPNQEARNGDIVLAKVTKGGVLLKKFHRKGPEGKTIRLESTNKEYPDFEYSVKELAFIYPALEFKRLMGRR